MTSAYPFAMRRTVSSSSFDSDKYDPYMFGGHNNEWAQINGADILDDDSDFFTSHHAGLDASDKLHLDLGIKKKREPETPLRNTRGNSISAYSGMVTPQSAGRSFSINSLPYTPSFEYALPSPKDTPLGTPLEMPIDNPFDTMFDPKMTQWDLSDLTQSNVESGIRSVSTVNLSSLHKDEPDETFGANITSLVREKQGCSTPTGNGSISLSTKPASALLSRQAACGSLSSSDLRRVSSSSNRKSSVGSGVNPFYCPPSCLSGSGSDDETRSRGRSTSNDSSFSYSPPGFDMIPSAPSSVVQAAASAAASFGSLASDHTDDHLASHDDEPLSADSLFTQSHNGLHANESTLTSPRNHSIEPIQTMNDKYYSDSPISPRHASETPLEQRSRSTSISSIPNSLNSSAVDPEKPFVCELCTKGFRRMEHLKRHTKTHTQERPFTCTVADCGRKFSRTDNLKAHILTHAKRNGRNKYVEAIDMTPVNSRKKKN